MTVELCEPKRLLCFFKRHISTRDRWAFLSAFCVGLITHLYMLVNKLPNHDDFLSTVSKNAALTSGRWFLSVPSAVSSQLSMPWINGLITLCAMALSCVLLMRLMDIRRRGWICLTCGLVAVFPSLAYTLCYMFTADAYLVALLLAVTGVYVTVRWKWGFFPGAALLGFSMGCYQAYFFFAVALLGVKGLLLLVSPEADNRTVLTALLRYAGMLALGLGIYYGALKLLLAVNHAALTDYMGINALGEAGAKGLLSRIPEVYRAYWQYLTEDSWMFSGKIQVFAFGFVNLLGVALVILRFVRSPGKTLLKGVLLGVLLVCWPLLFGGIGLLGTEIVHPLMLYALALVFLLPPALLERLVPSSPEAVPHGRRQLQLLGCYLTALVMGVSLLSFGRHDNETYFALELKYDNMTALCNRIVDRVEQMPGYTRETPVWFQGTIYEGNYPAIKGEAFARASNTPVTAFEWEYGFLMNDLYFSAFAMYYLGVCFPRPTFEEVYAAMETEAFSSMPYYPYEGSVKNINGIIFVRVGPGGTVW